MMGRLNQNQGRLFYPFCLDEAVPGDHSVRETAAVLDLSWVPAELAPYYSTIGRASIDPILMLRMLILSYVFAISSERALCREVQVNLAYPWFCGLSIEDKIPDPSAFSRARSVRFVPIVLKNSVLGSVWVINQAADSEREKKQLAGGWLGGRGLGIEGKLGGGGVILGSIHGSHQNNSLDLAGANADPIGGKNVTIARVEADADSLLALDDPAQMTDDQRPGGRIRRMEIGGAAQLLDELHIGLELHRRTVGRGDMLGADADRDLLADGAAAGPGAELDRTRQAGDGGAQPVVCEVGDSP